MKREFIILLTSLMLIGLLGTASMSLGVGDTWTQKADMPTARYVMGSAVVDGKIYVIGGNPGPGVRFTAAVEEYDPAADIWMKRTDMLTGRQSLAVAAVNGMIYAIGGWRHQALGTVEEYDPGADKWARKTDMPTIRDAISAVAVDGKIYVMGGWFNWAPRALSTVEVYDPSTDKWTEKDSMLTARCYPAACVVDGLIYVSGGREVNRTGVPAWATVEVYDPATDTWTQAADMPRPRFGHTASVVDGKMYIIGGATSGAPLFSIVDVYDPATDTWTTAADLPTSRYYLTASVVDGRIYAIGGDGGGPERTILSIVEEYDTGLPDSIAVTSPAGKLLTTWGKVRAAE